MGRMPSLASSASAPRCVSGPWQQRDGPKDASGEQQRRGKLAGTSQVKTIMGSPQTESSRETVPDDSYDQRGFGWEMSEAGAGGMNAKQQKLFELRMRMNEGRKMNHAEVAAEKRRAADPVGEAKRQKEMAEERKEKRKAAVEDDEGGKEEEDDRLSRVTLEQANKIEKKKAKKEKGKAAFGWDIFNQDSLYNAHKKRLAKMKVDLEGYQKQKEEEGEHFYRDANSLAFGSTGFQPSQEKVEAMVSDLMEKAEKRNSYSRRRTENEDDGIDYINDRNKHFNKKIERAFGEYTKVIKENLERGTAL